MKQGLVNDEDMISRLPEELILHILSFLPTQGAVATSALAKQWRSRWKMVPVLDFDYESDCQSGDETFPEMVCRVLLSHEAPVLERLRVRVLFEECGATAIGTWVGIAYARHVRELYLDVSSAKESYFKFPRSLYKCETLETLKLRNRVLVHVPCASAACLKSLRNLHLSYVDYEDEASSLGNLLAGCPKLENLEVSRRYSRDVETLIAVPSLQRLRIDDLNHWHGLGGGYNATELVEAKISHVSNIVNDNIVGSLTSAKRLCLNLSLEKITFPMSSIFYQLVYLELGLASAGWRNLLVLMLDRSPKLQVLKLNGRWRYDRIDDLDEEEWSQPKNVAECLLFSLETFVWKCRRERLEEGKEVAEYILRNACRLKRATVSIQGLNSEERLDLLEEMECVVRASTSSCQLLLLD
ncbi:unnamed protein product [Microthlaspi erraticum]|uniref:FBD domain-containing protein n=1 Tax=Microthlaspi erraticum TaxID=1685480 RepID=A0A6D2HLP6_9BRAS|nr:unnamed protein product [Microthlaspi erraticum]